MKRPAYVLWLIWIAENDEPEEMDVSEIAGQLTVCMVADLFGYTQEFVADGVLKARSMK